MIVKKEDVAKALENLRIATRAMTLTADQHDALRWSCDLVSFVCDQYQRDKEVSADETRDLRETGR